MTFNWNQCSFVIWKILGLNNYANSYSAYMCQWNRKALVTTPSVGRYNLLKISSPFRITAKEKKSFSKYYCSLMIHLFTQVLMEVYNKITIVSCLIKQHPFCSPRSSSFHFSILLFKKGIVKLLLPSIVISLMGLNKVNWKPCGKNFPFRMPWRTPMIYGRSQTTNVKRSLRRNWSDTHGWLEWRK